MNVIVCFIQQLLTLRGAKSNGTKTYAKEFSNKSQERIIKLISEHKKQMVESRPESLIKLHSDIELVTLEKLIKKYEIGLQQNHKEQFWQNLFKLNPFILSMSFGFPAMMIGEQSYVGGKKMSGGGDKITDFVMKNNLTDNIGLIEIKTPQTTILHKTKEYRGLANPSSDLSGSINQLLNQKQTLQRNFYSITHDSEYILRDYSIRSVLIIGSIPQETEKKRSFELFRGNSKDVDIITFDELLEKLKSLHSFLSSIE